jgi:hypothetical protein
VSNRLDVLRGSRDADPRHATLRATIARIAGDSGFRWWQAGSLGGLVELGLDLGRLDEAAESGREALHLARAMEDLRIMLFTLVGLARIDCARGDLERAGRLWGAVAAEIEREGLSSPSLDEFARPLAEMGDSRFHGAARLGQTEGLDAAIGLALGED